MAGPRIADVAAAPQRARTALLALLAAAAATGSPAQAGDTGRARTDATPAAQVRSAFAAWRDGRGSVFDLLADDVVWTVAGDSPVSGTYHSRQAFLDRAVAPIAARLATPIVPTVERIVADGDHVVVLWHGTATARDGRRYANHYAWHLELAGGRIVRATAFLDTWALQQLMR